MALRLPSAGIVAGVVSLTAVAAQAQPLGTFAWQLQPFCNVVTVNVTQQGGVYTIDGYDGQCGAAQRAPLVGLATPNPDGTIGLGLHVVTVPGGRGIQIDARITLAALGGSWSDSAGNSGTFAFNASTGGSPRPAPTVPGSTIAAGSISALQLAPGAIGAAQINAGQVQARVGGTCAHGQALRGVNPDGTVVCTDALTTADAPASDVGNFSSMAIGTDGLPVIAHHDATLGAVRVTHCGNAACTNGNVSTTVDDPANHVGFDTSIAIGVDGLPIVSYRDVNGRSLRVTHCGNQACTAGNVSTTVDPLYGVGFYASLAIGADGLPIISHQDAGAGALRVTHCGTVACTAGNVSTTVDAPGRQVGRTSAIAIGADGLAIISHQDGAAGALRVTHCGNVLCTAGNVSVTVDDPVNTVGLHSAIAIGTDGLPIISHSDQTARSLRVAKCGTRTCQ